MDPHRKRHPSRQRAGHERALLRLVQGPGVVPLVEGPDDLVVTACGRGSVADLLCESGPQSAAVARATGARVARAVARLHAAGVVHGDVKPANVVFAPDGDLWLVDFDAAGSPLSIRVRGTPARGGDRTTLSEADDVAAIAVMVLECATGVIIDPAMVWDVAALEQIGCPADLAADIVAILRTSPSAERVAAILERRDDRIPSPPRRRRHVDPTPTIDIASVAIVGLSPVGDEAGPG